MVTVTAGSSRVAQGREAAQVGKQHRDLAPLGCEGVLCIGESLHDVGRYEPLELTLQLLQPLVGSRQQALESFVFAATEEDERGQAQENDGPERDKNRGQRTHSSNIASLTVALAKAATPMASSSAAGPSSLPRVRVISWIDEGV